MSGVVVPAATNYNPPLSQGRFVGIYPFKNDLPIILSAQVAFEIIIEHHVAPNSAIDDDRIKIVLAGVLDRLS